MFSRHRDCFTTLGSLAALAALAPLAAACMTAPENGTSVTGPVAGKTFTFQGYYNEPGAYVRLEVLKTPGLDVTVNANWVEFGAATTGAAPVIVNGDTQNPLYSWSTTAAPVPASPTQSQANRWPQDGVARVRAVHPDSDGSLRTLVTFDAATFDDCFATELAAGSTWVTIGNKCRGVGNGTIALTSEPATPPVAAGSAINGGGFLGRKRTIDPGITARYYAAIGAPPTLAAFKAQYGFPSRAEARAVYYNDGDLGLGREMHCKTFPSGAATGVACYVSNYSGLHIQGVGVPAFGVDPNQVLADAVAGVHSFATVAMVYTPPATAPNSVKFIVYDAAGNRSNTAQLDSTANNVSIPNNCLSCHGIHAEFNSQTLAVSPQAHFLPFDPFSFRYASQPGFTFNDQQEQIRQLNAMVKLTAPAPATTALIDGMYPAGVNTPNAAPDDDYVPYNWTNVATGINSEAIYRGVVKIGCRSCHASADPVPNAPYDLDFADSGDFINQLGQIANDVCGPSHIMPHAEHVQKRFWQSGARGYLISAYAAFSGGSLSGLAACKP